jgi:hypothetical protein
MRDAGAVAVAPCEEPEVIDDVDLTLRRLIEDKLPRPRTPFTIRFDQPSDDWQLSNGLNLNLYLYDLRENLELRDVVPRLELQPDGTTARRQPPARINLFYAATAWSAVEQHKEGQILEEHRLLADVLRTLLRYPTIPPDVLQGALVGQEPPLPTLVAQVGDGLPHPPSEFWSALQSPIRPALNLIVTVALQPESADPPQRFWPVASGQLSIGPRGGSRETVSLRPRLRENFDDGAEVARVELAATSAGTLATAVRAAADVIDVDDAGPLRANAWARITDGPNGTTSDYFRVPVQTSAGPATLPVEPPLRFAHAAGRTVERLTVRVAASSLAGDAGAGDAQISVSDRTGRASGDLLMIDDGEQTEFVQLTGVAPAGPGPLSIEQPLRYDHESGRPIRLAVVAGAATALSDDVNQPAADLEFAPPAPALPAGTVVMIGSGPEVEFARLGALGAPRPVEAPLRGNHPAGTPVRAVTTEDPYGELARRASEYDSAVVVGTGTDGELQVGQVIRIGLNQTEPSYHELTQVRAEPGGPAAADRFADLVGRVLEDGTGLPVPRATVVLVKPASPGDPERALVRSIADSEGHFMFRDVALGSYLLRAQAPRHLDQDKAVSVLSTRFDDYVVRMTPN